MPRGRTNKTGMSTTTTTDAPKGGSALKAQLDSVRYPAGHHQERRRVVTTQVAGTPRQAAAAAHQREGTAPAPSLSSPSVKSDSPSCSRQFVRAAAAAKPNIRPSAALLSSSPLRKAESLYVMKVARPTDEQGKELTATTTTTTTTTLSSLSSPSPSPARTPSSKLKLRKSIGQGKPPGKTPANSPGRGHGKKVLRTADNK